jgi:hypothetical protein
MTIQAACRARALLPLPNMLAAEARYGIGGHFFGQLPFADWARLSHYVRHNLVLPSVWAASQRLCTLRTKRVVLADRAAQDSPVPDKAAARLSNQGRVRLRQHQ